MGLHYETMLPIPTFDYRIYVIFCENIMNTVRHYTKKEKWQLNDKRLDELDGSGGFHFSILDKAKSYIFLPIRADSNQIVHESYHAICRIMRWIEAEHEEELFAYHLSYVVQMIVQDQKKAIEKYDKIKNNEDKTLVDLPGVKNNRF